MPQLITLYSELLELLAVDEHRGSRRLLLDIVEALQVELLPNFIDGVGVQLLLGNVRQCKQVYYWNTVQLREPFELTHTWCARN